MINPSLAAQTAEIDRLVANRLAALDPSPAQPPSNPDELVLRDFNHMLHELRSIELRRLPVDGGVLLSAGCAGAWYFEWLEDCAGPFEEHIGVELYSPRPDGLASNVRWIAQSASDMSEVGDSSVDVVFSGQNIEHLWIADLVGFLLESHRVLRPDGVLVVDSPNRLATEGLGWSHPEHTIEITAGEAAALFELAGFSVELTRGLWNCRDRRSGTWLPLIADTPRQILDRSVGRRSFDDDFVWWIEARRADRPVDHVRLGEHVAGLFDAHWHDRVNRVQRCAGTRSADGTWNVAAGADGELYRTWGFPLFAGDYRAAAPEPWIRVRLRDGDDRVFRTAWDRWRAHLTALASMSPPNCSPTSRR